MASNIPKQIRLPFGYTVKIVQCPYEELLHRGTEDGGYWSVEERVLYLDQDLPLVQKRYVLLSNLFHITLDLQHEALDSGLAKP